jgi:hypothetical protein
MAIHDVLNRLEKVRKNGASSWRAKCPAHKGTNPTSLLITEKPDGAVLMHCFAHECPPTEIVQAIGLTLDDIYPQRAISHHGKPERRPFFSHDAFKAVITEVRLVYLAALDMTKGRAISPEDMQRLLVAIERIHDAYNLAGGTA